MYKQNVKDTSGNTEDMVVSWEWQVEHTGTKGVTTDTAYLNRDIFINFQTLQIKTGTNSTDQEIVAGTKVSWGSCETSISPSQTAVYEFNFNLGTKILSWRRLYVFDNKTDHRSTPIYKPYFEDKNFTPFQIG